MPASFGLAAARLGHRNRGAGPALGEPAPRLRWPSLAVKVVNFLTALNTRLSAAAPLRRRSSPPPRHPAPPPRPRVAPPPPRPAPASLRRRPSPPPQRSAAAPHRRRASPPPRLTAA